MHYFSWNVRKGGNLSRGRVERGHNVSSGISHTKKSRLSSEWERGGESRDMGVRASLHHHGHKLKYKTICVY